MPDLLLNALIFVIFTGVFVAPILYIWLYSIARVRTGTITLNNGAEYEYTLGSNMTSYGGARFSGLEIVLPAALPHMYFDNLDKGGRHNNFYPDPSQLLSLEGDFSAHYQVFVPKTHEVTALSILTPDVMAV